MSEHHHFGCACCSANMLPRYEHDHAEWQALLADVDVQQPLPAQQSVIFWGGTIYPDPEQPGVTVEAVGIAKGQVIATGDLSHVRDQMAPYAPQEQQLEGTQTLLPGLIDPHAHLLSSAMVSTWLDLSPLDGQRLNTTYSIDDITKALNEAVQGVLSKDPDDQWVTGFGIDPSLMTVWTDIDATYLAQFTTCKDASNVKIFLLNASGHISYANKAALDAAGVPDTTNGVLTEEQSAEMLKVLPKLSGQQALDALRSVFTEANARGITTVFDASIGLFNGPDEVTSMKALAQTSAMTLRVGGALYGNGPWLPTWLASYSPELSSDGNTLFTVRAMKLIADGSNQGLTGFQSQPYACCDQHTVPDVGAYGLFNFVPVWTLGQTMAQVADKGWPILTHANGDEAIANVLAAYQTALSKVPPPPAPQPPYPVGPAWADKRHRIEHCSLLHDDAIGQMNNMAISPSFLIGHVGYWGNAFQKTILGADRANLLDRCASALKGGLRISLHSDRFVTPFGPLRYMEQAIGRVMEASGEVLNEEECLDVHQALRAVTIDAAWQCHLDHQIGSLLEGKQADLVILATDPLQLKDPQASGMRDTSVLQTWVSGRKVFVLPQ